MTHDPANEERSGLARPTSFQPPPGTKLVGRRLPGVHLTPEQRGQPLEQQVEEVLRQAGAAAEPLPEQAGHVPAIGALASPEGAWGVFCMRCSADAHEYIYPCQIDPSDWPPQVLVPYTDQAGE